MFPGDSEKPELKSGSPIQSVSGVELPAISRKWRTISSKTEITVRKTNKETIFLRKDLKRSRKVRNSARNSDLDSKTQNVSVSHPVYGFKIPFDQLGSSGSEPKELNLENKSTEWYPSQNRSSDRIPHLHVRDIEFREKIKVSKRKLVHSNNKRAVQNANLETRYFGSPHYNPSRVFNPIWRNLDDGSSSTFTPEGTEGPANEVSVVGLVLALFSVIFIIIGLAFVFSRFRKKRHMKDEGHANEGVELAEVKESDPYTEWLNMPEEEPPNPTLKKQVKQVVRTVSRKISLKQQPQPDRFIPGVPDHLRYQLKQIYVY